jgi:hypothetical protein
MKSPARPQRPVRLLVCEGPEDRMFFDRLIDLHADIPKFFIYDAGGNRAFATALRRFKVEHPREFNSLVGILIVADKDEEPDKNFREACAQIGDALGIGSVPSSPLVKSRRTQTLRAPVTVMMVPLAWISQTRPTFIL